MGAHDLVTALADVGIRLRSYAVGPTHRAPCPRCNKPRDDALAVTIHASDDAVWTCHRCGWAAGWRPKSPIRDLEAVPIVQAPKQFSNRLENLDRFWLDLWKSCRPITDADPVGRYLRNRCCALPANDVRWHPNLRHHESGRSWPCMVALVTDIRTCEPINLHRTWIAHDGSGKAPVKPVRKYCPRHRTDGGVIRLFPDDEITQGLIVCEGVETGLTAALEFRGIWSCMDAGNLGKFPVLPGIEGLTVITDNDPAGIAAFEAVKARYEAAGIEVIEWRPEVEGEDLNDLVAAYA